MLIELPFISFLCAALLSVFLLARRVNSNVASLSLVCWLIFSNLIHGVNAVVWADNTDFHIPVWCDIVTKLLLGANVAVPGACACLALQIELVSSSRRIDTNLRSKQLRTILEIFLCCMFPVVYMSWQFLAQDFRFNLVENFGPFAAIHPSTPALIIIWLPPIFISVLAMICCGICIHHSFSHSAYLFTSHLESRSGMSSSLFIRRIVIIMVTSIVLAVVSLFSVFSVPVLEPWTSWNSVHEHFTEIKVVTDHNELGSLKLSWWGVPIVSLVYIFLSYTMGEETRDLAKWMYKQIKSLRGPKLESSSLNILLPTHASTNTIATSRMASESHNAAVPPSLALKSGWDDMLDLKSSKRTIPLPKSIFPRPSPSPTPTLTSEAACSSSITQDESFKQSTLTYLSSHPAQTLGLPPPVITPPPSSAGQPIYDTRTDKISTSWLRPGSPPARPSPSGLPQSVAEDCSSTISSLVDVPWPQPPPSIPLTPSSVHSARSPSPASDDSDAIVMYDTLRRSPSPPYLHQRPFEGSTVSPLSAEDDKVHTLQRVHPLRPKRPSMRDLRRPWSREHLEHQHSNVIYMTVVKETV